MFNINNKNPFNTYRLESKNGKDYLVAKSVPIVEGVLNKYLVSMDEFGAFVHDWNGVPLVLRHPKQNNRSARVPSPDVPVVGNFYSASLDKDNKRLTGEYWFETAALLASDEGKKVHDDILAGKMIETSTGYYANIESATGFYNGLAYVGIQHEIHPDHIAILPDEIGACSIRDGCGVNRNSSIQNCEACRMKLQANMTGNLPAEAKKILEKVYEESKAGGNSEEKAAKKAWGAVKRSGWTQDEDDKWVKANCVIIENASDSGMDFTSSSMIAYMLPDEVKEKVKGQFPFVTDETMGNMHLTLAFLGETDDLDAIKTLKAMFDAAEYQPTVKGKVQGLARFISGGEQDAFVLTFDSPSMPMLYKSLSQALDWKGVKTPPEHGFIPHITLAYIGKDEEIPAGTFEPFDMEIDRMSLVNGNEIFLTVPFYDSREESTRMNSQAPSQDNWLVNLFSHSKKEKYMDKFKELVQKILNEAGWSVNFDDSKKTASATLNAAPLSETLTGLESIVNEAGGPVKFKEMLCNLSNIPASIQALSDEVKTIKGSVDAASQMAQNAAAKAEADKKAVVARLVANAACPLGETVLNGMDLESLEKLEVSFRPTNYAALGAFVPNSGKTDDDTLVAPSFMLNYQQKES